MALQVQVDPRTIYQEWRAPRSISIHMWKFHIIISFVCPSSLLWSH